MSGEGGQQKSQKQSPRRGLLSFRTFYTLTIIVVFPASGIVSFKDVAFTLFSLVYVFFLSKVAFPILDPSTDRRVFGKNNKLLSLYISFTALIGLILPIGYIIDGILEGDKERIKAAAPHIFLLCGQGFMEGFTFNAGFSIPIFAFVPVFYHSRRIFTIVHWLRAEMGKTVNGELVGSAIRVYFGRGLAVVNLLVWCFNLFGFLLPVYLPRAFKRYYGYKEKV
ncbi:uncharacterized protein LOC122654658 [Telopea speciosissima]|uniref:uncharacterized protein LOC122654658 n=1 Tax=Telopea speciosissima TaxID=54955 RepID=UPI001CC36B82|nr:uncharacterized protein LOC122654658 [Telopea speciosissima]